MFIGNLNNFIYEFKIKNDFWDLKDGYSQCKINTFQCTINRISIVAINKCSFSRWLLKKLDVIAFLLNYVKIIFEINYR